MVSMALPTPQKPMIESVTSTQRSSWNHCGPSMPKAQPRNRLSQPESPLSTPPQTSTAATTGIMYGM